MTIRIKYNAETGLVVGNYPLNLNYPNITVDTEARTIDGSPYLEVTTGEHKANLGKVMCVVEGVYQEYVKPNTELLTEAQNNKMAELKAYLKTGLLLNTPQTIPYSGNLENKSFKVNVEKHLDLFNSFVAKLQRSIDAGVANPTRGFTDAEGTRLDLNISDFKTLANHLDERDERDYGLYTQRKIAVMALTDPEAIAAYDITTTDFE
tara:strand:+ start:665 stop:1285 length:621 start_codon:yes stop_codon:yes gene_type:complete